MSAYCAGCTAAQKSYCNDRVYHGIGSKDLTQYMPSGWDKRNEVWKHSTSTDNAKKWAYNAIPSYYGLYWASVRGQTDNSCSHSFQAVLNQKTNSTESFCNTKLWTGVASRNLPSNSVREGCETRGAYPKVKDDVSCNAQYKWPSEKSMPRMHPYTCWYSGFQYLMAEKFDTGDSTGGCRRIGKTSGHAAATAYSQADAWHQVSNHEGEPAEFATGGYPHYNTADPQFAGKYTGAYEVGWSSQYENATGGRYGRVQCVYPEDSLETDKQAIDFERLVLDGKIPSQMLPKMLARYCLKKMPTTDLKGRVLDPVTGVFAELSSNNPVVSPCPVNEIAETRNPSCVRFAVVSGTDEFGADYGEIGRICRTWWRDVADTDKENFLIEYCERDDNKKSAECACMRANDDKVFRAIEGTMNINKACFWKPCKVEGMQTLKTPSVLAAATLCTAQICQNVNTFIDSENIDVSGSEGNISCNIGEKTTETAPDQIVSTSGGSPVPPPVNAGSGASSSAGPDVDTEKYWTELVVGAVIALVLVLALIWYAYSSMYPAADVVPEEAPFTSPVPPTTSAALPPPAPTTESATLPSLPPG